MMKENLAFKLSSKEILSIPVSRPEDLFMVQKEGIKELYYALIDFWRIDRKSDEDSKKVIEHINKLFKMTDVMLQNNVWRYEPSKIFTSLDGIDFKISWKKYCKDDIGNCYIGDTSVAYEAKVNDINFVKNASEIIRGLDYKDDSMRGQLIPLMPHILSRFETNSSSLLVLKKRKEDIRLKDLREYLGGHIESKHIAWIISGLLNILCYLEWSGLTHNAISEENVYVSPSDHRVSLLGGWFFARPVGQSFIGLPFRSIDYARNYILKEKVANYTLDVLLIKRLIIELSGEDTIDKFSKRLDIPQEYTRWLLDRHEGKAFDIYQSWFDTLAKAFGKRRFAKLDVMPNLIYP